VDWLDRLARRSSNWLAAPFATYVAVFLMLLLRGSLMIAFAFGAAAALAFVCAFALLSIGRWHPGRRFYGAAEPASPAMRTKV
jgi:predicted lysophospholipase L1 biosynthesis ABC-type transport system permease subunit